MICAAVTGAQIQAKRRAVQNAQKAAAFARGRLDQAEVHGVAKQTVMPPAPSPAGAVGVASRCAEIGFAERRLETLRLTYQLEKADLWRRLGMLLSVEVFSLVIGVLLTALNTGY